MKTTTVAILTSALVAGCAPSVVTGSVSGAGGATDAVATATSASSVASTAAGNGTGGDDGSCKMYEDAKSAPPTTVRFVNRTGQPLYVSGKCATLDYSITPVGGNADDVSYVYMTSCLGTCQTQQMVAGPPPCISCPHIVTRIDPNGSLEQSWNGAGLKSGVAMPASCYAGAPSPSCEQIVDALPGKYQITAAAYAECGPTCTCDATGLCTGGDVMGLKATPDPALFVFPSDSLVEVVFGPCSFGCL